MIETPAEILSHAASPEAASSFVAWRKKVKAPLTETAATRLLSHLMVIKQGGGDPSDALALAEERGWKSVTPEWYFRACPAPAPVSKPAGTVDKMQTWAEMIKSGKPYLCRNITSAAAREMVEFGLVTSDQCKRAGVQL